MANLFDKGKYQCAVYSVSGLCLFDGNYAPKKFCMQTKPYIFSAIAIYSTIVPYNQLDLIWVYDTISNFDWKKEGVSIRYVFYAHSLTS